jgi:TP901 family phage tail tape measure protein
MFTDIYIKAFDQASATMMKIGTTHGTMTTMMLVNQKKLTATYMRQTLAITTLTKAYNFLNIAILGMAGATGIAAIASIGGALAVRGWQASMSRAAAVMGLTAEQEDVLGKKTLELAQKWGLSSDVIADGLFELVKSGYEYNEIMEMMEPIVMAAVGNNLDFAQTTTVLMNAQRVFHKQFAEDGLKTIDIIDRMQYAANVSLIDMYDFAEVIEYAGGAAVLMRIRFEELISMSAVMRDAAIKSNRSLTTMFMNLVKNSEKVQTELRSMGYTFDVFAEDGTLNISKIINAFKGMEPSAKSTKQFLEWLNVRSFKAWAALVTNAERYEKILGEVSDAEGYAQKLAEDRQKELSRILERLREAFLSAFKKPEYLDRVVEMLENLMPVVTELGLTFATFAVTSLPVAEKFLGMVTVMMPVIENLIGTVSALANIYWYGFCLSKHFFFSWVWWYGCHLDVCIINKSTKCRQNNDDASNIRYE